MKHIITIVTTTIHAGGMSIATSHRLPGLILTWMYIINTGQYISGHDPGAFPGHFFVDTNHGRGCRPLLTSQEEGDPPSYWQCIENQIFISPEIKLLMGGGLLLYKYITLVRIGWDVNTDSI
jgi:hypothetical protein